MNDILKLYYDFIGIHGIITEFHAQRGAKNIIIDLDGIPSILGDFAYRALCLSIGKC